MKDQNSFKAPAYWHTWLGICLLFLLSKLPFKSGLSVGRAIGITLYYLVPKRRKVTEVNTQICFPEMDAQQRTLFVKDVFRNNGIGIIETAWAFWGCKERFKNRVEFHNLELLEQTYAQGKGIILLGGHYSSLDLGGLLYSLFEKPLVTMYRQHNNPLMDKTISAGRSRYSTPVERKKLRELVKMLRKNYAIWYGPDQDLGRDSSVFVPFFGQPAATVTATSKMVRFNDSPLLAFYQRRKDDDSGYIIEVAEVPGFPSGDEVEDARLVNKAIEAGIRKAPAQYMWMHKRFKTQPDGDQKLYKQAGC
ncbi:MAG: lysophospholipid acyltransferase family protein [Neptuniibacter sp.]